MNTDFRGGMVAGAGSSEATVEVLVRWQRAILRCSHAWRFEAFGESIVPVATFHLMRGILHPAAPGGVLRPAAERVIALFKEANPVPDLDCLPETQHRWPAVDGRIGADDDIRSSIKSKNDLANNGRPLHRVAQQRDRICPT